MRPSQQSPVAEPQASPARHPFAGLPRQDGPSLIAAFEDLVATDDDADEGAGFDFHLGVYSKY